VRDDHDFSSTVRHISNFLFHSILIKKSPDFNRCAISKHTN